MAAKLIRQLDQLALVGAPTSAAASAAGVEHGPAALRAAGIVEQLSGLGYQVADAGDQQETLFHADPENPRVRNLNAVLAGLEALRLRVERVVKTHAFPLVVGGDASIVVGLITALRRQAPSIGLVSFGRRAQLRTPMRTDDGIVEAMTDSHLVGQGAPELVRFWKDPPLVREPDLILFGLDQPDEIDRERMARVAVRPYLLENIRSMGPGAAAESALEHLRAAKRDFVVHIDVDVFAPEEVPGSARGLPGGLSVAEAGEVLNCLAARQTFAGLSISGYDPSHDPEGRGARAIVGLLVAAFAARYAALRQPAAPEPEDAGEETAKDAPAQEKEQAESPTEAASAPPAEQTVAVAATPGEPAAASGTEGQPTSAESNDPNA